MLECISYFVYRQVKLQLLLEIELVFQLHDITRSPAVCWDMADCTVHSRRSVQMLWRIHLAMLIYRDRWAKVKIRISVQV